MTRKEKKPTNATAKTQDKPKPAYCSYGKHESEVLCRLDPRCLWLYFRLKWLSNFKTGVVGKYEKQKLNYEKLARMAAIPVRQGMTPSNIDGTEIKRLLQRLEGVGLVADIDFDGTRLTMNLPMSPIKAKEVVEVNSPTTMFNTEESEQSVENLRPIDIDDWKEEPVQQRGEEGEVADQRPTKLPTMAEKLPNRTNNESPQNPHEDWGSNDFGAPLSVMTSFNTNQYLSVPETGEAPASPNTGEAFGTNASPPHPQVRPVLEGYETAKETMCELEIMIALSAITNPPVLHLENPNSLPYFRCIEAMGVKEQELKKAIDSVSLDSTIPMTPSAILHELRRARAPKQMPFARAHVSQTPRSRVAL